MKQLVFLVATTVFVFNLNAQCFYAGTDFVADEPEWNIGFTLTDNAYSVTAVGTDSIGNAISLWFNTPVDMSGLLSSGGILEFTTGPGHSATSPFSISLYDASFSGEDLLTGGSFSDTSVSILPLVVASIDLTAVQCMVINTGGIGNYVNIDITSFCIGMLTDTDGDGTPDEEDAFPNDPNEWLDTDGDTIGNNADTDDDNDSYLDVDDAFPLDSSEWLDTDGDTIGNNADTDDDNDSYLDVDDAFPLDSSEWLDTDGDTIGNNADTDDDNDTILDYKEIEIGSNPLVLDTLQSLVTIIDNLLVNSSSKFSIDEIEDLRPGSIMVEVSGNQATVQLQMEESSDLQTWEDTGTPATMTIPADTDTKFFRFKMVE